MFTARMYVETLCRQSRFSRLVGAIGIQTRRALTIRAMRTVQGGCIGTILGSVAAKGHRNTGNKQTRSTSPVGILDGAGILHCRDPNWHWFHESRKATVRQWRRRMHPWTSALEHSFQCLRAASWYISPPLLRYDVQYKKPRKGVRQLRRVQYFRAGFA